MECLKRREGVEGEGRGGEGRGGGWGANSRVRAGADTSCPIGNWPITSKDQTRFLGKIESWKGVDRRARGVDRRARVGRQES